MINFVLGIKEKMPGGGTVPITQDKARKSGFGSERQEISNCHDKYSL